MTIGQIHITDRFKRERVQNPDKFKFLRIVDIGKSGSHKLIVGKSANKKSLPFEPQAILHPKSDSISKIRSEKEFDLIRSKYGKYKSKDLKYDRKLFK